MQAGIFKYEVIRKPTEKVFKLNVDNFLMLIGKRSFTSRKKAILIQCSRDFLCNKDLTFDVFNRPLKLLIVRESLLSKNMCDRKVESYPLVC